MKRQVEFYVLLTNRMWTTVCVYVEGEDCEKAEVEVEATARRKLEERLRNVRDIECVGPLYYMGVIEEEE